MPMPCYGVSDSYLASTVYVCLCEGGISYSWALAVGLYLVSVFDVHISVYEDGLFVKLVLDLPLDFEHERDDCGRGLKLDVNVNVNVNVTVTVTVTVTVNVNTGTVNLGLLRYRCIRTWLDVELEPELDMNRT